jgi:hypothetical protein
LFAGDTLRPCGDALTAQIKAMRDASAQGALIYGGARRVFVFPEAAADGDRAAHSRENMAALISPHFPYRSRIDWASHLLFPRKTKGKPLFRLLL